MIPDTDKAINRSDLPSRLREHLREHEDRLDKKCRNLWTFTNPHGERFVFARLGAGKDATIVTISRYADGVGWVAAPFHYL